MTLSIPAMSAIRFGYGIRPGEEPPDGPDALLSQLAAGARAPLAFPEEGIEGRHQTVAKYYDRMSELGDEDKETKRKMTRSIRKEIFHLCGRDQHAKVAQAVFSPHGFYERLANFWVDHFSVSTRKQRMMYLFTPLYEAEALRPNLAGPFSGLLRAAAIHPAMLIYLDQVKSVGPNSTRGRRTNKGLNENLGRELLELHTLGADGGYTQDDVRNAALVLTGLAIDRQTGETRFRRNTSEPGPIEVKVLGKSYGDRRRSIDNIHAMLDDLAAAPQTAKHICRKLAVHFISDTPPEALMAAMLDAWQSSGGNLTAVYSAMLKHPAAWENPGEKARQPFDYIVTGLRAAQLPEADFSVPDRLDEAEEKSQAKTAITPEMAARRKRRSEKAMAGGDMAEDQAEPPVREKIRPPLNRLTVGAIKKLGQPVWEAASPEGSEEEFDAWISSSQITGRIEWAQKLSGKVGNRTDPAALMKTVLRDAARADTIMVVSQAPSRQAGLALVLASPEFNRR